MAVPLLIGASSGLAARYGPSFISASLRWGRLAFKKAANILSGNKTTAIITATTVVGALATEDTMKKITSLYKDEAVKWEAYPILQLLMEDSLASIREIGRKVQLLDNDDRDAFLSSGSGELVATLTNVAESSSSLDSHAKAAIMGASLDLLHQDDSAIAIGELIGSVDQEVSMSIMTSMIRLYANSVMIHTLWADKRADGFTPQEIQQVADQTYSRVLEVLSRIYHLISDEIPGGIEARAAYADFIKEAAAEITSSLAKLHSTPMALNEEFIPNAPTERSEAALRAHVSYFHGVYGSTHAARTYIRHIRDLVKMASDGQLDDVV